MTSPALPDAPKPFRLEPGMRVHLVGIGGFGLSAIARVLLGKGYRVSGSDQQVSQLSDELARDGATVYLGHRAEQVAGAELVLVSSAVPAGNPEIRAARKAGIPVVNRAEFLGQLMAGQRGIAVAGSHGKTTTTGMIAQVLVAAGLDPSVIMGGLSPSLGGNGRAGNGPHFLVEADEYDFMFHGLRPQVAVITNVDYDHPDQYESPEAYRRAFEQFATLVPAAGGLVVCSDNQAALEVAQASGLPAEAIISYGLASGNWQASEIRLNQLGGSDFLVERDGMVVGLVRIRVPGEHNIRNALAAIAVASHEGVELGVIRQALATFGGVNRRFQVVGEAGDVVIVDDYAHHPTEIRATLAAARQRFAGRRLWAVWEPHTFSRTQKLLADFAASFEAADRLVALDIYRSRETDTLGVDTAQVLKAMKRPDASHQPTVEAAAQHILERARPGDVIIMLTAGEGNRVGWLVLAGLRRRLGAAGAVTRKLRPDADSPRR